MTIFSAQNLQNTKFQVVSSLNLSLQVHMNPFKIFASNVFHLQEKIKTACISLLSVNHEYRRLNFTCFLIFVCVQWIFQYALGCRSSKSFLKVCWKLQSKERISYLTTNQCRLVDKIIFSPKGMKNRDKTCW